MPEKTLADYRQRVAANGPETPAETLAAYRRERAKRETAVSYGIATAGIEGLHLSPEGEARAARFVAGEIDTEEWIAEAIEEAEKL